MGTISAYMNVSLAFYYYLVIKHSWDETRLKKIRWALFLFPMAVGFAFAFAGIPFYDSLNLWCNNTASYWPDIGVAIAIGLATIVMTLVCWDVYTKEKASMKWKRRAGGASGDGRQTLSSQVFWQSFFYLMAFYATWSPYLGLQYAWAGGSSFTNYGLILTAATLVPLQGFWNCLVYVRPRHMKKAKEALSRRIQTSKTASRLSWTKRGSKPSNNTDPKRSNELGSSNLQNSNNHHVTNEDEKPEKIKRRSEEEEEKHEEVHDQQVETAVRFTE